MQSMKTNQQHYQIDNSRPLFISAQRGTHTIKPALNNIHVDSKLTERLLGLISESDLPAQEVTSKQVFSDTVVAGMLKGVIETVITVCIPITDGRISDLCALLSNHKLNEISDIIRHEWSEEGLISINISGYKQSL